MPRLRSYRRVVRGEACPKASCRSRRLAPAPGSGCEGMPAASSAATGPRPGRRGASGVAEAAQQGADLCPVHPRPGAGGEQDPAPGADVFPMAADSAAASSRPAR